MGTALWWAANAVVVVGVFPLVAFLALRIIRALRVAYGAAVDIRSSLASVAGAIPPAMTALGAAAERCERLSDRVTV
jgi:hypothetical protein